jgi:predicted DNA-binding mobile mystery protein A
MNNKDLIAFSQFERRIKPIRKNLDNLNIKGGWIHYVRSILGIKLTTLAKLTKTTSSAVQQAEKREAQGKVTLETLNKMANAMDCEFVYAFVPKKEIRELVEDRAVKKARMILRNADMHMELEDQKVKQKFEDRVRRLAVQLMELGEVW